MEQGRKGLQSTTRPEKRQIKGPASHARTIFLRVLGVSDTFEARFLETPVGPAPRPPSSTALWALKRLVGSIHSAELDMVSAALTAPPPWTAWQHARPWSGCLRFVAACEAARGRLETRGVLLELLRNVGWENGGLVFPETLS